jgi:hypothetical protein
MTRKTPQTLTDVQHALIDGHKVMLVNGTTEQRIIRIRHWADSYLAQLAVNERWIEARLSEIVIHDPETKSEATHDTA